MSGWVLAVALVAAVVLLLGLVTLTLARQVRRLRAEVNAMARSRVTGRPGSADPVSADPVSADPVSADPPSADPARSGSRPPARGRATRTPEDDVLRPTPIGPAEVEPDLRVARVASVTLSGPLIKVAAFSHGVRRALDEETRMRVAYAFRKELRRQRRMRRQRAAGRAAGPPRDGGWHP